MRERRSGAVADKHTLGTGTLQPGPEFHVKRTISRRRARHDHDPRAQSEDGEHSSRSRRAPMGG